ncbi:hypothetical protein OH799_33305 [Nocardia sp. NBC_00881]|uniref:hypothetical protein n=1 Tax=Nocardia sp. NBC_00881 TaxID=2975995 RepID=UPI00386FDF5C|nr:hypothetical protein OH799_33305 [Nocardia sp. NBC_00881]
MLEHLRDAVTAHLSLPQEAIVPKEATTGVKRNINYLYPARTTASSAAADAYAMTPVGVRSSL